MLRCSRFVSVGTRVTLVLSRVALMLFCIALVLSRAVLCFTRVVPCSYSCSFLDEIPLCDQDALN